jgi:hypothetical protein
MLYVYFNESKRAKEISNQSIDKTLKITNVISGKTEEFNPNQHKISLYIKAGDIAKLKEKPVGKPEDLITVFEIEIASKTDKPQKESEPDKKTAKKETKKEAKEPEKSNLDAKPVSN